MSKTKATVSGSKGTENICYPVGTHIRRMYSSIVLMLYSIANNGKLSGRADGNVYMRNGRVRGMKVPRLVRNTFTQTARGFLSNFSSLWRTLLPAKQLTWLNYETVKFDRFANAVKVRGNQAYIATNTNLSNIGVAPISTAPSHEGSAAVELLSSTSDSSHVSLSYVPVTVGIGLVYATAQLSNGIFRPSQSAFRLIGIADFTATGPVNMYGQYFAKFGAPLSGTKIFIQVRNINDTTGEGSAITAVNSITP